MAEAMFSPGDIDQETEQANFEKLPDELVVIIFSCLNPEDIVCNVARVCTRWRDLARDPKVWEASCLSEEYSEATLEHLISVLNRYKGSLQEVDFYINDSPEDSINVLHMTIFGVLSCMDSLKCLKLRGRLSSWVPCEDIFKQGWPELKSLDICKLSNSSQLVLQIMKHKGQSLQKLFLCPGIFSPNTLCSLYDVCVSSSIETLKICETYLMVVKNLSSLQTLHIVGLSDRNLPGWQNSCPDHDKYQRLYSWVRFAPHFSNLKRLTLENVSDDGRNLIEDIFSVCINLEYLTLYGGHYSSSKLRKMLKNLKFLKKLCIHHVPCFNASHLKLIPVCLPNLCVLDLRSCMFKSTGIFMNYEEEVQTKMPNLKLFTDWCYFDKKGARLLAKANHYTTVNEKKNAHSLAVQKVSQNVNAERVKVLKMLDEFSDYEED